MIAATLAIQAASQGKTISVSGPASPWAVTEGDRSTTIYITAGAAEAQDIRVVHSELVEQKTHRHLDAKYLFLRDGNSDCDGRASRIDVPANASRLLRLCLDPRFAEAGNWSGKLTISPAGKEGLQLPAVTLSETSFGAQAAGTALILGGVLLAWFLRQYITNRASRAQALLGFAVLGERVHALTPVLEQAENLFQNSLAKIRNRQQLLLTRTLSTAYLEEHLLVPSRFPFLSAGVRPEAVSQLATQTGNEVDAVSTLVWEGVAKVLSREPSGSVAARTALQKLDAASESAVDAVSAKRVAAESTAESAKLLPARAEGGSPGEPLPTARELFIELRQLSQINWFALSAIAAIAGWVALIAPNSGFGVPVDYAACLGWGFGLPTVAGAVLPASPATAITISPGRGYARNF